MYEESFLTPRDPETGLHVIVQKDNKKDDQPQDKTPDPNPVDPLQKKE